MTPARSRRDKPQNRPAGARKAPGRVKYHPDSKGPRFGLKTASKGKAGRGQIKTAAAPDSSVRDAQIKHHTTPQKEDTMKAFCINKGRAEFKDVEGSLQAYYQEIGCELIDITSRSINGKRYDIICDDEGLFAPAPIITALDPQGHPQLVGGLIIANYDGHGGLAGLEAEDVLRLSNALQFTIQQDGVQPVIMLDA